MSPIIEQNIMTSITNKLIQHDLKIRKDQLSVFGLVIHNVNLDALTTLASTIRRLGHSSTRSSGVDTKMNEPSQVDCKILDPKYGSFNIVFPIEFTDGVQWMLRIPANGHTDKFSQVEAASLVSEAETMLMIKRGTSVPVPEVYAFDASLENELGAPFILMEKLEGKSLWSHWYSKESKWPKARLAKFRSRLLETLAEAMVQLNHFTVDSSGSLSRDANRDPLIVSGAKTADWLPEIDSQHHGEAGTGDGDDATLLHEQIEELGCEKSYDTADIDDRSESQHYEGSGNRELSRDSDELSDHEPDIQLRQHRFYERGPFKDPKKFVSRNLDRPNYLPGQTPYGKGCKKILHLLIDWAFEVTGVSSEAFVLNHPDLDPQNILVAEDGTLTGLIDWDGSGAVPRAVGCAQYPLWLMRDWVPAWYEYYTPGSELSESSSGELATHREMYAQFMEAAIRKMTEGSDKITSHGALPDEEANVTRRSLFLRSLQLAADVPVVTKSIVEKMIEQIAMATVDEWQFGSEDSDSTLGESPCASQSKDDLANAETTASRKGGGYSIESREHTLPNQEQTKRCSSDPVAQATEGSNKSHIPKKVDELMVHAKDITLSRKARLAKGTCKLLERGFRRTAKCLHRCHPKDQMPEIEGKAQSGSFSHFKTFLHWPREKLLKMIEWLPVENLDGSSTALNDDCRASPDSGNNPESVNTAEESYAGYVTENHLAKMIAEIEIRKPALLNNPEAKKQAAIRAAKLETEEAEEVEAAEAEAQMARVWMVMADVVHNVVGIDIRYVTNRVDELTELIVNTLRAEQCPEYAPTLIEHVKQLLRTLHGGQEADGQDVGAEKQSRVTGAEAEVEAEALNETLELPGVSSEESASESSDSYNVEPTAKEMDLATFDPDETESQEAITPACNKGANDATTSNLSETGSSDCQQISAGDKANVKADAVILNQEAGNEDFNGQALESQIYGEDTDSTDEEVEEDDDKRKTLINITTKHSVKTWSKPRKTPSAEKVWMKEWSRREIISWTMVVSRQKTSLRYSVAVWSWTSCV